MKTKAPGFGGVRRVGGACKGGGGRWGRGYEHPGPAAPEEAAAAARSALALGPLRSRGWGGRVAMGTHMPAAMAGGSGARSGTRCGGLGM